MSRWHHLVFASALAAGMLALLQPAPALSEDAQHDSDPLLPQNHTDAADASSSQQGNRSSAKNPGEHPDQDSGSRDNATGRGASGLHSTGTTGHSSAGAQGKNTYSQPDARANLPPSAPMANGVAQAGQQIASQGVTAKGVVACMACHGDVGQGNSVSGFPRLAGFPEVYLRKQLHDYATGARAHPIMTPIAAGLTPEQRRNVAAYYASQQVEGTDVAGHHRQGAAQQGSQQNSNNRQGDDQLYSPPPAAVTAKGVNTGAPGGTAAATIAPAGASQQNDKAVRGAPVMPSKPARARMLADSGDEHLHAQACANCHGPAGTGLSPSYPPLAGQNASYLMVAMNEWRDGTRHNDPSQQMPMIAKSLSDSDIAALSALFSGLPPTVAR